MNVKKYEITVNALNGFVIINENKNTTFSKNHEIELKVAVNISVPVGNVVGVGGVTSVIALAINEFNP